MGAVVNYAIFSQYLPSTSISMDYLLKEFGTVTNTGEALFSMVQPFTTGLKTFLPAIFGFFFGTLLLFVWNWLKSIAVRRLLEYDGWMLRPKNPINKARKITIGGCKLVQKCACSFTYSKRAYNMLIDLIVGNVVGILIPLYRSGCF